MLSIKTKVVLVNLLIFGMALFLFGVLVFQNERNKELALIDSHLKVYAVEFALELEDELDEEITPELSELYEIIPKDLKDVKVVLTDSVGTVLLSNSELLSSETTDFSTISADEIVSKNSAFDGNGYRDMLYPIKIDGRWTHALRLITPLNKFNETMNRLFLFLLIVLILILAITSISVYYATKSSLKPLTAIAGKAERITGNNLNERLPIPGANDEIKQLSVSLNTMMERIENAFENQRRFVANASHELRTPLTIIYTELEYAKRFIEKSKTQESIDIALGEIDRLKRIADQLLMLIKIDAGKLTLQKHKIRLDELLVECIKALGKFANKRRIELGLSVEQAIEANADGEKLNSVFMNVIHNAIKYSPPGMNVQINLEKEGSNPEMALITVTDKGPGIGSSELKHVFDRFYRGEKARADTGGGGLGLSIAKEIVELHKGLLEIESEEARGTKIIITLPINN